MRCLVRASIVALALSQFLLGQFSSGIQGTISDATSALVPGARIQVLNVNTGVLREAISSPAGTYNVLSLAPGTYRITVTKEGFTTAVQENLQLAGDEIRRVEFRLEVGPTVERVNVSATVSQLETEQGRISGRLEAADLRNLPAPGRNVYNLLSLQPGVTGRSFGNNMYDGEPAPGVRAAGQRSEANYYTIDDTSVNSVSRGGTINITPSLDSVAEVRVISHSFSAEEGRNSGAHIQVVTKSGTNSFHGTASEYFTNNTLSARNIFETSLPVFRQNQFGYSLGGPVIKNRLFFFTSYEGFRRSGARVATATVETPQFRQWVIANRPNSIAAKIFSQFAPSAEPTTNFRDLGSPARGINVNGPADGIMDVGTAQFIPDSERTGDQFNVRMDYELRPGTDRLYGNWYRTKSFNSNPGIRPQFNRPQTDIANFGNINYTHTFNPTTINEFRGGVMRLAGMPAPAQHLDVPELVITGSSGFQSVNLQPGGWFQTNYNYKNTLSLIRGSHTYKIGGEFRRMHNNLRNTRSYIPVYTFASLLDFADDEPREMSRTVDPRTGEPSITDCAIRVSEWGLFIQDDWKVKRNLTFNIGLRYEYYGPITDAKGALRTFLFGQGASYPERIASGKVDVVDSMWPADKMNFAPRLGFAWDVAGKGTTAIRGGYGIAYDRLATVVPGSYRDNPPLRAIANLGQPYGTAFTYTLGDLTKPHLGYTVDPGLRLGLDERNGIRGARVTVVGVDPGFRNPIAHDWFLAIQRSLPGKFIVEASYMGTSANHLINVTNVNRFDGDMLLDNRFDGLNPSFAGISMSQSTSNSIFHGGTFSVRRPLSQGVTFQAAYTYGKIITDAETAQGVTAYQSASDRERDRSLASFNVPQRLSFMAVWDLPFLRTCRNVACRIAGGWQLTGYGVLEAGSPFSVITGAVFRATGTNRGDFNADNTNSDRPNAPAESIKRKGFTKQEFLSGIFNVADFPLPAPGTLGNLGRNTFQGPGFARVDVAMLKSFNITERISAVLRGEAFNALNRANLNTPSGDMNNNNFGRVTGTQDARTMQVSLQIRF